MQNSPGTMTAERGGNASGGGLLLHRDAEIAVLAQCWDSLDGSAAGGSLGGNSPGGNSPGGVGGRPSVVLIKGTRGSGKSALLARAIAMLPQPAVVLRARCTLAEKAYPLGVVGQLFGNLGNQGSSGPDAPEIVSDDFQPGSRQGSEPGASHDVMHGLFQTTKSLAVGSPVVIAIDDLHLADPQSLQWFSYITRRLDDLPVTVIATLDSDSGSSEITELSSPQLTTILRPGPLCDSCTEELAGHILGGALDPELSAACFTISQGNPLVLNEFLRRLRTAGINPGAPDLDQMLEIGTAALADTAVEWLQQRDPTAADLLAGLAVLGPAADPNVAAILVGQGEYVAGQSWDSLIRAGLVDPGPPATFANPLLGPAALTRIDTSDRLRMHARAAELLMRLGSSATEAAEHVLLVGGGASGDAPGILRSAARAAAELGDWADAVRYLRRALAESDDPVVTTELSAQLGAVELHHDLRSSLRYAATTAAAMADPVERARALLPLVGPLLVADAGSAARVFVETGAELSRSAALRSKVGVVSLISFGAMSLLLGHRTGIRRWMRDLPRPSADDFGWESEQRTTGAMLGSFAVLTAAAGRHRRSAMRFAELSSESADGGGLAGATLTLSWAGELARSEELAGRMTSTARSAHHLAELALALVLRADAELRRGRVAAGLNDAQEAIRLAELTNARGVGCAASSIAALCLVEQGHLDEATSVLRPGSPADGHPLVVATTWHAQSVLALARGNADDALRLALESGHRLASHGITTPSAVRWRAAAVAAYLALGASEAALALAAEDVTYARRWGSSVTTGAALTTLSHCLTGADQLAVAHEAVAELEGTEADLDRARAMAALAQAYRANGSNSEAAQLQHRASELRARCGAVRGSVSTPESGPRTMQRRVRLTTSESKVSDLVLQGMSNQEVADELCISRRTVDTHLNRIYRKLEIRSRSELAAALEQLP